MTGSTRRGDDEAESVQITDALAEQFGDDEITRKVNAQYQSFHGWMITQGKDHLKQDGMSEATAENYIRRLDQLHREAVTRFGSDDVTLISDEQADELLLALAKDKVTKRNGEDYGESAKRKFSNTLRKYLEWRFYEGDFGFEWRPKVVFSDSEHISADDFSYEEMGLILDESESYGSLPTSYYEASDEEKSQIGSLIAQRLGKPKEAVTRDDWKEADQGGKYLSLVSVGYEAGLAPKEVAAAEVQWYKQDQGRLLIPTESAVKERTREKIPLSDAACEALNKWLQKRRLLEKYDGTNKLWLNREGNPYDSGSLCGIIRNLCEKADIPTEDREIRWYSLRHTLGKHMAADGSINQVNDQLRHETLKTTIETYSDSSAEEREETLNKTRSKIDKAADDPGYEPYRDVDVSTQYQPVEETVPDDAVTTTDSGDIHANAHIKDTMENRADLAQQLLSDEDSSNSS